MTTAIDRRDVQGNVVTGYRFPEAAHLFAAVDDAAAVRKWLRGLEVTTDADMAKKPDSARNVALSHAGLRALSAPESLFSAFPAFAEGMAARGERLGDDCDAYAPFWERAHVWVSLYASSSELLERRIAGVRRAAAAFGVSLSSHVVRGRALLDGTSRMEHFGFRDGMSNPAVAGIALEAGPGTGKLVARHRILRRGMPYGELLPEGVLDDDGEPRGLLFIAMNASIERQFEFIQERWLNAASASGLGDDGDPLLAACGAGRMVIQGDAQAGRMPILLSGLPRFVSCRGGEYFFMPGISALNAI